MIRRSFAASTAAAVILLGGLTTSMAAGAWKPFTSREGRFTVQMPTPPKSSARQVDSAAGKITVHMFAAGQGRSAYVASFTDYPGNREIRDPQRLLAEARNGQLRSFQGKVIDEKKVTLDGAPGTEVRFEGPKLRGRIRSYLVKNRLYQVVALTQEPREPADFAKFVGSFQLARP